VVTTRDSSVALTFNICAVIRGRTARNAHSSSLIAATAAVVMSLA